LQRSDPVLIEASFNDLTGQILAAAIEVHRTLGPGLLESIYSQCLRFELSDRQLQYVTQQRIPITYKKVTLDAAYRLDLIVEGRVVVEVKSVATILAVHQAQMLTYLALTGCPVGLLINFNEAILMMA
jgi:GxxExxY protein